MQDKTTAAVLRGLWYLEATVCVLAFAIAVLVLMADVVGRELWGHGLFGAQRIAVWATAVTGLVGFGLITAESGHLRPRFADGWLPQRAEPVVGRVADIISACICVFLGIYAIEFVRSSHALGERGVGIEILLWPLQLILPWMFLSSAFRYICFAAKPALKPAQKTEL